MSGKRISRVLTRTLVLTEQEADEMLNELNTHFYNDRKLDV